MIPKTAFYFLHLPGSLPNSLPNSLSRFLPGFFPGFSPRSPQILSISSQSELHFELSGTRFGAPFRALRSSIWSSISSSEEFELELHFELRGARFRAQFRAQFRARIRSLPERSPHGMVRFGTDLAPTWLRLGSDSDQALLAAIPPSTR